MSLVSYGSKLNMCRICLLEPEENRNIKFHNIFEAGSNESDITKQITETLGMNIENDNNKPNIICEHCKNSISGWSEFKKKAVESTIIINYFARKTPARASISNPCSSSSIGIKIEENDTELLPVERSRTMNVLECQERVVRKPPHPSTYRLFTCLKPSCNFIFPTFDSFKIHHRYHFKYEDKRICWQCCDAFSNFHKLRTHQSRTNCHTPGMFKCFQCSERFDDLESFSIHKFRFHHGVLVPRKNNNTITCAFCQNIIHISSYKNHLESCN